MTAWRFSPRASRDDAVPPPARPVRTIERDGRQVTQLLVPYARGDRWEDAPDSQSGDA